MGEPIKLSSAATRERWEIQVLFEDDTLLAVDKPAGLLTSPDRGDKERPNLMWLLHQGIESGAAWAKGRSLNYLANVHRLDLETSGVFLLAKNKPALVELANQFGSGKPEKVYLGLAQGVPREEKFEVDLKLAPDPVQPGMTRVNKDGKKSITRFSVLEVFQGYCLLECRPLIARPHQIRVHLQMRGMPLVADALYGGRRLFLSRLKPKYRPKPDREERPLIGRAALHAQRLVVNHPVLKRPLEIEAPWPKDLRVAVRYLREFAQPR